MSDHLWDLFTGAAIASVVWIWFIIRQNSLACELLERAERSARSWETKAVRAQKCADWWIDHYRKLQRSRELWSRIGEEKRG